MGRLRDERLQRMETRYKIPRVLEEGRFQDLRSGISTGAEGWKS